MKNYFIVNPIAGKKVGLEEIKKQIALLKEKYLNDEFFVYVTKEAGDATTFAKKICLENKEEFNLFACGGDGTCFEVVNGIVGFKQANLGIIPIGSCNDFLKTFPDYDFSSIEKQLDGKTVLVDLIKVGKEYVLNVANFGFDAKVNYDQVNSPIRKKSVKKAYNRALFKNILAPNRAKYVEIYADDELVYQGKMLLITVANAKFYGGGYQCAPLASYDDGLLELFVIKNVSLLTFVRLVKYYKQGLHLTMAKFKKLYVYKQTKKVKIVSTNSLIGSLDGETRREKSYLLEILKQQIKFIIPKK